MAKEFDFDELDKAVNSLMKDAEPESPTPSVPTTDEPPATPPPTPPVDIVEPSSPAPATPIEPEPAEAPAPVSTPATPSKPTGRFMDVVHPSSDMRTASPAISREGAALAPISPVPNPSEGSQATVAPVEPEAAPDPVTLPPTPLASPFLPDAQVEKRPLGGTSPETSSGVSLGEAMAAELNVDSESTTSESGETTSTPIEPEPVTTSETEATEPEAPTLEEPAPEKEKETIGLPEELSTDLVAIESGEAQPEGEEKLETPKEANTDTVEAASSPAALLSQASIPQQYKEEESSTAETHAPIYDDQTSASAVPQPAKKNNKVRILLIVVIAIVVGITGAAGLYFLQFSR